MRGRKKKGVHVKRYRQKGASMSPYNPSWHGLVHMYMDDANDPHVHGRR
jgi:hypothetical protein